MVTHEMQLRVRYDETDKMGFVFNGYYSFYYSIARIEFVRDVGKIPYKEWEDKLCVFLPVTFIQSEFLKPATFDELLTIKTVVPVLPDKDNGMKMHHEFFNEQGILIHRGLVLMAFIRFAEGKGYRCDPPNSFIDAMKPFFSIDG